MPEEIRRGGYSEIIDVRSPAEFDHDHIPGAVNLPVLDDSERQRVGILYTRDAFAARKLGAALVARNIARHIEAHFLDRPRDYRPLIYCWRGGYRSRSLAIVLREIGWAITILSGGYRAYRTSVRERIAILSSRLRFRVVTGLTGTGKTRWLEWLSVNGGQVLNLEKLAGHRGSIFGDEVATAQPTQKFFESLIAQIFEAADPAREIWIEGESRRIGRLVCPDPLWQAMTSAPVIDTTADRANRVDFLLDQYRDWIDRPTEVIEKLSSLTARHSRRQVAAWQEMVRENRWSDLIDSLLAIHYDPTYGRFPMFQAPTANVHFESIDSAGFASARFILAAPDQPPASAAKGSSATQLS